MQSVDQSKETLQTYKIQNIFSIINTWQHCKEEEDSNSQFYI